MAKTHTKTSEDKLTETTGEKSHTTVTETVISAELHAPIRMNGHTETNLNKIKMPHITKMWWQDTFLIVESNKSVHKLPGAAVKDSVIVWE